MGILGILLGTSEKTYAHSQSDCPQKGKRPEQFRIFGSTSPFTYRYPASAGEEVSSTPVVRCGDCGYSAVAAETPANNPLGAIISQGSELPVHP